MDDARMNLAIQETILGLALSPTGFFILFVDSSVVTFHKQDYSFEDVIPYDIDNLKSILQDSILVQGGENRV